MAGRLSCSQKSISGRFGRAMDQPLYLELKSGSYQPTLSGLGASTLQRRKEISRATRPRIVRKRGNTPDTIRCADAATSARIAAAVLLGRGEFNRAGTIEACSGIVVSGGWIQILPPKSLMCGLEMMAIIHAAVDPPLPVGGECVNFYTDNIWSKCPLVKSDSGHLVTTI